MMIRSAYRMEKAVKERVVEVRMLESDMGLFLYRGERCVQVRVGGRRGRKRSCLIGRCWSRGEMGGVLEHRCIQREMEQRWKPREGKRRSHCGTRTVLHTARA